jgi:hypothetical protein
VTELESTKLRIWGVSSGAPLKTVCYLNLSPSNGLVTAREVLPSRPYLHSNRSASTNRCPWSRFVTILDTRRRASSSATADAPRLGVAFCKAAFRRSSLASSRDRSCSSGFLNVSGTGIVNRCTADHGLDSIPTNRIDSVSAAKF